MNNTKQLSRLMVFTVVAQKKSFTKAANYLGISKSAASQQVSQLETQLGIRLLNRTTRQLALTTIGMTLFERCLILQDQIDLLFNDIAETIESPSGRFAVTFPHSLQSSIILPAIEQLCVEYPNLQPVLIADDKPLDLIEQQIDVAIHVGELPDSGYRALPVGSLTEVFCASANYINAKGEINTTQELLKHRWAATAWQNSTVKVTDIAQRTKETIHLNQYATCNTLPAAIDMALRNLCIVLVPDVLAKPLILEGKLIQIAKHIEGPKWPVYTVHAFQQEKPAHIARFHQLICGRFN